MSRRELAYFWNFISTYVLWVPFLLAIPIVVPRIRRWLYAGDRAGAVLLLTPAAGRHWRRTST